MKAEEGERGKALFCFYAFTSDSTNILAAQSKNSNVAFSWPLNGKLTADLAPSTCIVNQIKKKDFSLYFSFLVFNYS